MPTCSKDKIFFHSFTYECVSFECTCASIYHFYSVRRKIEGFKTKTEPLHQLVKSSRCKYCRASTYKYKGTLVLIKYLTPFHRWTLCFQYIYRLNSEIAWKRTKYSEWIIDSFIDKTCDCFEYYGCHAFSTNKIWTKRTVWTRFSTIVIKYWWKWLIDWVNKEMNSDFIPCGHLFTRQNT